MKILLALLLVLTGCRGVQTLTVRNSYLNADRYASLYVDSPDPEVDCPVVGQVLSIHWNVPLFSCENNNKVIAVRLRFGDTSHEEFEVEAHDAKGILTYSLLDENYFSKKGIISYHVALYADGELVKVVQHQLWAEIIDIGED